MRAVTRGMIEAYLKPCPTLGRSAAEASSMLWRHARVMAAVAVAIAAAATAFASAPVAISHLHQPRREGKRQMLQRLKWQGPWQQWGIIW